MAIHPHGIKFAPTPSVLSILLFLLAACIRSDSDLATVPNVLCLERPAARPSSYPDARTTILWHRVTPEPYVYFIPVELLLSADTPSGVPEQTFNAARDALRRAIRERRSTPDSPCYMPVTGGGLGPAVALEKTLRQNTVFVGKVAAIVPGIYRPSSASYPASLLLVAVEEELNDPRSEVWEGEEITLYVPWAKFAISDVTLCTETGFPGEYRPKTGDRVLVIGRRDESNLGHFSARPLPIYDGVVHNPDPPRPEDRARPLKWIRKTLEEKP